MTDLEYTHSAQCPSCGRTIAAGTRCQCQPPTAGKRPPRAILCPRWGLAPGYDAGEVWHEPDRLERLLERAAILAVRTGSKAQRGIREAIEATKGEVS